MAMIRALVAVFPEGSSELGYHGNNSVAPFAAELLGQSRQSTAQAFDVVGQCALSGAFVDVRVPAADIDKANSILIAHEATDATRFQLEALRADGIAAGFFHLHFEGAADFLA